MLKISKLFRKNRIMESPTEIDIYNACLSYRHDFGLLKKEEQKKIASEAVEWLIAWQKTLGGIDE